MHTVRDDELWAMDRVLELLLRTMCRRLIILRLLLPKIGFPRPAHQHFSDDVCAAVVYVNWHTSQSTLLSACRRTKRLGVALAGTARPHATQARGESEGMAP